MCIYAGTARFDNGRAMTENEMRKIAQQIFATSPIQPIPTIEILRGLTKEGFFPVGVTQSATRTEGKAEFTRHLIRLRRVDDGEVYNVGDTVCEILLKNSNDGTSAYELMAGLFRVRRLNSLFLQMCKLE